MSIRAALVIISIVWSSNIRALPITVNYDEAVAGDLTGQTFNLGTGFNTVAGVTTFRSDASDFDNFFILIQPATELAFMQFAFAPLDIVGGTTLLGANYTFRDADITLFEESFLIDALNPASPFEVFDAVLPTGPGQYELSHNLFKNIAGGGSWSFQWVFNVRGSVEPVAVPEPSTLMLLGFSLFALVLFQGRLCRSVGIATSSQENA
jgi:hypothetical protein